MLIRTTSGSTARGASAYGGREQRERAEPDGEGAQRDERLDDRRVQDLRHAGGVLRQAIEEIADARVGVEAERQRLCALEEGEAEELVHALEDPGRVVGEQHAGGGADEGEQDEARGRRRGDRAAQRDAGGRRGEPEECELPGSRRRALADQVPHDAEAEPQTDRHQRRDRDQRGDDEHRQMQGERPHGAPSAAHDAHDVGEPQTIRRAVRAEMAEVERVLEGGLARVHACQRYTAMRPGVDARPRG